MAAAREHIRAEHKIKKDAMVDKAIKVSVTSIYDIHRVLEFWTLPVRIPPLSTFGTDLQY